MEKILVLNPGSTSTKIAVFDGETPLFVESLTHSAEELAPFDRVVEQYDFRRQLVLDCLARHDFDVRELNAIVSRGGLLAPIHAGAYEVNEDMVWQLQYKPQNEHASNVGPMIAHAISQELHIPAYIYDGITVDELTGINRITGLPEMRRRVSFIAPVIIYPGEDEMQSLALGCLRVLRGEETARTYVKAE